MQINFFQFKKFKVYHDKCAMKVGTDGVLLGAWASCEGHKKMLDVGAGTGVISLMIAQRNNEIEIDAVEIDKDAAEQMKENFHISPWDSRLNGFNCSFQQYAEENHEKSYDFILSNPPYFLNSLKNPEIQKTVARHAEMLSYDDLITGVVKLLSEDGVFGAIFPYQEANIFVTMAALKGLYCTRRMDIKGQSKKPVKRVLLEFKKQKQEVIFDEMTIEEGERHSYSDKYINLTKNFYLKF